MEELNITATALSGLDAERKKKLKTKLDSGAFTINIVDEPVEDSTPTIPVVDTIDHSLPEGFGTAEYAEAHKPKELGLWEQVQKFGKKAKREFGALFQGADNVVNAISPVEMEISDSQDTLRKTIEKKMTPEDDVSFQTYKKIGELSKTASGLHDIGIGEVKQEDIDTYNKNLSHLLIDKMGYKDVLFDDDEKKYYVVTQAGKELQLNKDTLKTIIGETLGDKAEILGAMMGAKKGYDLAKVGGTKGKLLAGLAGGALGAGLGNLTDQFISAIETGERLTASQRLSEMNKAISTDVAGGVIAGTAIKLGGKALSIPKDVTKKIYGHLVNGNIDGAKKILKSDLGVDDEYIEEALSQMQKSQKQVYGTERNAVSDAIETAKSGEYKEALKELGDGALDTLGDAQTKEELLATTMSHPQGANILKESLASNPKGALELEKSIDSRAKQVLDSVDGATGTEAKEAVSAYEQRVHDQYSNMRDSFEEAFKETDYRFDLDDLKLQKTLGDLETRVTDPTVKDRFKAMVGAVENIVEQSKNGIGVERDVNALLDVRQMMNKFYRKNKSAFDLRPDKESFQNIIKNIDNEIESAMDKNLTPELKKEMSEYFDNARLDYREMYDLQDTGLYKALTSDGKSADDRIKALLSHAKDDKGELQQLLGKLGSEESAKIEESIVNSVLEKNTKGASTQMQSIDYAKVIDDLDGLKPFIRSDGAKKSIELVEDIYSKYRHDFDLSKAVKNVSEMVNAGGIGSSVQGRLEVATTSKIFRYVMTLVPWGDTPKRLALQRHIGTALKKSRTPVDLAKRLSADNTIPMKDRTYLKDMIKAHNQVLKAKNQAQRQRATQQFDELQEKIAKEAEAKAKELSDFTTPDITELRAVEKLHGDNASATLARTIRTIQEGKATEADVKRYLQAKNKVSKRLDKQIAKEKVALFPAKYRDIGSKEVGELKRLRDYLMSHENLKFGNEISPQKFKALIFDLEKRGEPRSVEYDEMYDELRSMYSQLESEIDEAYGLNKSLDDIDPDEIF